MVSENNCPHVKSQMVLLKSLIVQMVYQVSLNISNFFLNKINFNSNARYGTFITSVIKVVNCVYLFASNNLLSIYNLKKIHWWNQLINFYTVDTYETLTNLKYWPYYWILLLCIVCKNWYSMFSMHCIFGVHTRTGNIYITS